MTPGERLIVVAACTPLPRLDLTDCAYGPKPNSWQWNWSNYVAQCLALQVRFTGQRDRRERRQDLHRARRAIAEMSMVRRARRHSRARRWRGKR